MASQRYERVAVVDEDAPSSPESPAPSSSPPPSFHSRASSINLSARRRSSTTVDQNLADAFDADGSDSDSDEEGDARQRLMRSAPVAESSGASSTSDPSGNERPPVVERRTTHMPVFVTPPSTNAPASTGRVYGGGTGSDGVFANLSAKPETGEKLEEHPPTYEQAAADAAPPYWETTILAPGMGGPDEVYIEGLPVGSVFSFMWNGMISMSFQLVGFLLTYLLHTTHAAKNGSRAGLGITLVQYGFYMKGNSATPPPSDPGNSEPAYIASSDPDNHDFDAAAIAAATEAANGHDSTGSSSMSTNEIASYALMIVGWFILIRAVSDFLRARRHEQLVLQSPDRGLGVAVIAEGEGDQTVV